MAKEIWNNRSRIARNLEYRELIGIYSVGIVVSLSDQAREQGGWKSWSLTMSWEENDNVLDIEVGYIGLVNPKGGFASTASRILRTLAVPCKVTGNGTNILIVL
jgi:hypothetical protein